MTITPAETELQLSRLRNDVHALYDLLGDVGKVQTQHSRQLDEINTKLESLAATQIEHGARLDRVEARLDRVEARLDRVEARLDRVEAKLDMIIAMLGERQS